MTHQGCLCNPEPILWTTSSILLSPLSSASQSQVPVNSGNKIKYIHSSVQSLSHIRLFATPWIAAHQASLSITNSWSSLRLTSIESVMPSSHLILCCPLLLLPPIPPSIRVTQHYLSILKHMETKPQTYFSRTRFNIRVDMYDGKEN